jgi:hypothetical protein
MTESMPAKKLPSLHTTIAPAVIKVLPAKENHFSGNPLSKKSLKTGLIFVLYLEKNNTKVMGNFAAKQRLKLSNRTRTLTVLLCFFALN